MEEAAAARRDATSAKDAARREAERSGDRIRAVEKEKAQLLETLASAKWEGCVQAEYRSYNTLSCEQVCRHRCCPNIFTRTALNRSLADVFMVNSGTVLSTARTVCTDGLSAFDAESASAQWQRRRQRMLHACGIGRVSLIRSYSEQLRTTPRWLPRRQRLRSCSGR